MKELINISNEANWYSKKEICELVKCSPRTFSNFIETLDANDCNQKLILKRAIGNSKQCQPATSIGK